MLNEEQENIRHNTKIARICAESEELKELRNKLQLAMVNKERSNQIQEKIYTNEMEALEDAQLDEMMQQDKEYKDRMEYEQRIGEQKNRYENK
jgi:hypothetical protein